MKNSKIWIVAGAVACMVGFTANVRSETFIRVDITTSFLVPPVLLNENSEAIPMDSLAMLFWTSSSSFLDPESPPQGSPHANFNNVNPASPLGGDILLDALPTTGTGAPFAGHITNSVYANKDYVSSDYGVNLPSGYVYVVAFNLAYTTYQSIGVPVGTYYSLRPLQPFNVVAKTDIALPDDVGQAITDGGPYTMTAKTIIPEPGTITLFAIGSVAFLGLRRRFVRS